MKILFMGTPDFARECLRKLYEDGNEILGAVTQPDKPKGRHYQLVPPSVKVYAESVGIPVFQPETLKDEAFLPTLKELDPELIVVVAYGKILPPYVLNYPKFGCINAHGSLLPKYRGAAPIQRALMDGETETGITIIHMNDGIDTGDMILKMSTPITEDDDFESLHDRLADIAGKALSAAVEQLENGTATRTAQDDSLANYAAKITGDDCIIDFSMPVPQILCRIRALSPFPLAKTKTPDARLLKIISAENAPGYSEAEPGTVAVVDKNGFEVVCGEGRKIRICTVLPEGKGRMSAADFVRGRRIEPGDRLTWQK